MAGVLNRKEILFLNEALRKRNSQTNIAKIYVRDAARDYELGKTEVYRSLKKFIFAMHKKTKYEKQIWDDKDLVFRSFDFNLFDSISYANGLLTFEFNASKTTRNLITTRRTKFFQIPTALVNQFKNIKTVKLIELFKSCVFANNENKSLKIEIALLKQVLNYGEKTNTNKLKIYLEKMVNEINEEPQTFLEIVFNKKEQRRRSEYFVFSVKHFVNQYGEENSDKTNTAKEKKKTTTNKTPENTATSAAQIIQDRLEVQQHFNDLEEKKRQEFLQEQNKTEKIKSDPISENEKQRLQEITNTAENTPKTTHIAKQQPSPSKDPTYNQATPLAALFPEKEKPTQPNMYDTQDVATFLEEETPASDKTLLDSLKKLSKTDPERFKQLIKKIG